MPLPKWIQFVLLPRVRELIESGEPLPNQCQVGWYAVDVLTDERYARLLVLLGEFDDLVTYEADE